MEKTELGVGDVGFHIIDSILHVVTTATNRGQCSASKLTKETQLVGNFSDIALLRVALMLACRRWSCRFNPLALELDICSLAHHLCKM